jgi:hypothetical protein
MKSPLPFTWPPNQTNLDYQTRWSQALAAQGNNRVPPAPVGVQAIVGTMKVTLKWNVAAVDQGLIAGFRIFKDTESNLVQTVSDPNARSIDIPLTDNSPHNFFVASVSPAKKQSKPVRTVAQNGTVLNNSRGGNILPNPGFDLNSVNAPVNGFGLVRSKGEWLCDSWVIANSRGGGITFDFNKFAPALESDGFQRSGVACAFIRLQAFSLIPADFQWYGVEVESVRVPVKQGEIYNVGGYSSWAANVAIPAGILKIVRIGLLTIAPNGAVGMPIFLDVFTPNGGMLLRQATYTVPAGVAAIALLVAGYVNNQSGVAFNTGNGLAMDARFDDLFITPQLNLDTDVADGTTFRRLKFVDINNELSGSRVLRAQGSIVPNQPIIINFSTTTSQIALSWSQQSFLLADGSTLVLLAGSVTYNGLSANTRYNIFPYIEVATGLMKFTNGSPPPSGTTPQAVLAAQQGLDGRIPTDPLFITTPSSGTGGGTGGGGDRCPDGEELVEIRDKGAIRAIEVSAGDWIKGQNLYTGEDTWRKVAAVTTEESAAWRRYKGHKISPCEPIWFEEKWTPAFKVPGATFDGSHGVRVKITVEADEYDQYNYWLIGDEPLLMHNFQPIAC